MLAIDVNRAPTGIVDGDIQVYFVSIPCGERVVVAVENLLPVKTASTVACIVIICR